jgi:hypothetical protein
MARYGKAMLFAALFAALISAIWTAILVDGVPRADFLMVASILFVPLFAMRLIVDMGGKLLAEEGERNRSAGVRDVLLALRSHLARTRRLRAGKQHEKVVEKRSCIRVAPRVVVDEVVDIEGNATAFDVSAHRVEV